MDLLIEASTISNEMVLANSLRQCLLIHCIRPYHPGYCRSYSDDDFQDHIPN